MSFSYDFRLFYVEGESKFSESEQNLSAFSVTGGPSGRIEAAITGYMSVKAELEHAKSQKNVTIYKPLSGGYREMKLFTDTMNFARERAIINLTLSAIQWSEGEIVYSVYLSDYWARVKQAPLIENGMLAVPFELPSAKLTE